MDEYKSDIRAKLAETKQQQATTENENNVVEKVVENASHGDSGCNDRRAGSRDDQ